jgi:hypothetical protein
MTDAGSLVDTAEYYEVVWPLDRRDYLTVESYPLVSAEPPIPANTPITVASQAAGDGRRLAAKALLRGAHCPRKRIIELLRISKWTLERIAQRTENSYDAGTSSGGLPRVASSRPPAKMKSAGGPATNGAHAGLALEQVHALTQQQQRILHRSVVLDCALKADALDPPTMREAVADLLADITEAARAIGVIVQQATR